MNQYRLQELNQGLDPFYLHTNPILFVHTPILKIFNNACDAAGTTLVPTKQFKNLQHRTCHMAEALNLLGGNRMHRTIRSTTYAGVNI